MLGIIRFAVPLCFDEGKLKDDVAGGTVDISYNIMMIAFGSQVSSVIYIAGNIASITHASI